MRHFVGYCDTCRGLGACVEWFPWGLCRYVCAQGHEWIDPPPHHGRGRGGHRE